MRLLPILFALIGCSTTRAVSLPLTPPDVAFINDEVKEKGAAIQLRKEPCCRGGEDVVVSSDAIEWTDEAKRGQRVRAPPEAVERITVRYHGHGALAGAGVGLATGVVLGAVVAAGVHGEETAGFVRSAVVTVFGISGALLFAIAGGIIGAPHTIELTSLPP
ncbi:MAG: hypothetical protein E6J58_02250 [Deltaproteobacteria bacterium]|nr:MAG: hypothetical protein E6J67_15730 [Deltaproteobacteria bacterium]TMB42102.1 MAG: hypothetical protein E6J58_02250 [Deltaproteobacteria bacterium]